MDGQEKLAIINCANSIVIIEDFAITAHALVNRMNSVENFASSSYVLTNATITEDVLKKALVIVIKDGKVHFVRDRYVLWMKMVLYVVDMENVILTQKNVNAMIIGLEIYVINCLVRQIALVMEFVIEEFAIVKMDILGLFVTKECVQRTVTITEYV